MLTLQPPLPPLQALSNLMLLPLGRELLAEYKMPHYLHHGNMADTHYQRVAPISCPPIMATPQALR